jgi:hypothetical protein
VALERWNGFAGGPLEDEFRTQRRFVGSLIAKIYQFLRPKFIAGHRAGFRPTHF